MTSDNEQTRCGFVAIVGRPNVGKSTLLNAMMGKKISITSFKPQTTRHQVLGIKTVGNRQTIFVDTPGIHIGAKKALNRQMNRVARQALHDVNAILFVVEALKWTDEDDAVAHAISKNECPIFVVINKIDLVPDKERLLRFLQNVSQKLPNAELIPVSVHKKIQIDTVENLIEKHIPESPFYFGKDQEMNHSEHFHISEIIREKLMRSFEKEIPYATTVQIEQVETQGDIQHVHALIWVEREGQKGIIVGDKGQKLKEIGIAARHDLERFYDQKVCLKLWVKVKESWSDDVRALQDLGYLESK